MTKHGFGICFLQRPQLLERMSWRDYLFRLSSAGVCPSPCTLNGLFSKFFDWTYVNGSCLPSRRYLSSHSAVYKKKRIESSSVFLNHLICGRALNPGLFNSSPVNALPQCAAESEPCAWMTLSTVFPPPPPSRIKKSGSRGCLLGPFPVLSMKPTSPQLEGVLLKSVNPLGPVTFF